MPENTFRQQPLSHCLCMFCDKLDQFADASDLAEAYSRTRWQTKYPSGESLGLRQAQASLRIGCAIRFHAVASGIEIATAQSIFCPQDIVQLIASNSQSVFINFHDDILIVALLPLIISHHRYPRYICQVQPVPCNSGNSQPQICPDSPTTSNPSQPRPRPFWRLYQAR